MQRASGILMPISSLYGEYGCGSFSKSAYEFVDFLSDCGFKYWQVLPLCLTDQYNSPYASVSSVFGNPNFIDLNTLFNKGLLTKEELAKAKQNTPYLCEYSSLNAKRIPLLKKAALRVKNKQEVLDFINKHQEIKDACLEVVQGLCCYPFKTFYILVQIPALILRGLQKTTGLLELQRNS